MIATENRRRLAAVAMAALLPWLGACSHTPAKDPADLTQAPSEKPLSRSEISSAQRALADLGFYDGAIDGIAGSRTRIAVKTYQSSRHEPSDGLLTRRLAAELKILPPAETTATGYLGNQGPVVEVGDLYLYSDSHVESVSAIDGTVVHWQDGSGASWSTERGLPLTMLSGGSGPGGGSGLGGASGGYDLTMDKAPAYPLRAGEAWRVSEGSRGAQARSWDCRVEGRHRLEIPAGSFDTYAIECARAEGATSAQITAYYAPIVGHAVRVTSTSNSAGTVERTLVAVRLSTLGWPAEARVGFAWALRHALGNDQSNHETLWRSTAVPGQFLIVPGNSLSFGGQPGCRQFAITRTDAAGLKRVAPGIACPSAPASGAWRVPGDPGGKLAG